MSKRALITGAASGIGAGIASELSELGYEVVVIDKSVPQNEVSAHYQIDLSDLEQVSAFVTEHRVYYELFVHAAGMREICKPTEVSLDLWQQVQNVNVNSAFVIAQSLIGSALSDHRKMNVISIASVSGFQAEPDRAAYVTSKYALIGLTKQLAYQYGQDGIRCNAIAPGVIETPMTAPYFEDLAQANKIADSIPVGYWGQVGHITSLVKLCLENDYMNGATLVCDGGWTVGRNI